MLGAGCAACRSMVADVERLILQLQMDAHLEYVTDMEKIMSYGVLSTPVLVINGQIVMIGYRGRAKIESALKQASEKDK